MAKEPTINFWCDQHLQQESARVEGDTVMVLVPGKGVQELELCEPDQEHMTYVEVVTLAAEVGRNPERVTPPKKAKRSVPAAEGDEDSRIQCRLCASKAKNRNSLGAHLRKQHDLTLTQYEGQYGPA